MSETVRRKLKVAMQENDRLRASSFVTAVSDEAHKKLKSEVEQLKSKADQSEAENTRSRNQYNGIIDTQMKVIDEFKAEVERLTKAGEVLKHQINYWTIESDSNHARWLRVLGDYDQIRAQVKQLIKSGDA